jgi:hypothetical protein
LATAMAVLAIDGEAQGSETRDQLHYRIWLFLALLESGFVGFVGTDAHGLLDRNDEDLAVADFTGLGRDGDGINGLVDLIRRHDDLDLEFRNEVYCIFGAR